ncbi:9696_t:CDS:2 [Ambispora leptoticha]|uniref:9696_t:CDS:1 n=1 Tax=Ambispora leptoticha TaxID=144679 RepID=A0A9N8VVS7_9GLOM|nr:9696_t:CDS:2 [Ambispora leptoticha]
MIFSICRNITTTNTAIAIPAASISSLSKIFTPSNFHTITKTGNFTKLSSLMLIRRPIVSLTSKRNNSNSLLTSSSLLNSLSSVNKTNKNNGWRLIPVRHASYRKLKTHTGTKKRQMARTARRYIPTTENRTQRSKLLRLMPYSKTIKKMRRLSPAEIFSNVNAR